MKRLCVFAFVLVFVAKAMSMRMVGGYGLCHAPNEEVVQLFNQMKGRLLTKHSQFESCATGDLSVLSYRVQVVAGTNYKLTVGCPGDVRFAEVDIFKPLPYTGQPPKLVGVKRLDPDLILNEDGCPLMPK